MRWLRAVAAAVAALVLAACGTGGSPTRPATPSPGPTPPPGSTVTTPATPCPSGTTSATGTPARSPSAAPAATLPADLLGQDITVMPTTAKVVALTFDAGANADGVAKILATLDAAGVRGTFLLTGTFSCAFPAAARAITAGGNLVGNHSNTHPHFPELTEAEQRAEIAAAAASIERVTGRPPGPLFRFPFGDRTAATIAVVNDAGYLSVRWTVDTLGWKGTSSGQSTATVLARVLAGAQPGEIVLMHVGSNPDDGSTLDADALAAVIAALRARGYGFVTLDALLR